MFDGIIRLLFILIMDRSYIVLGFSILMLLSLGGCSVYNYDYKTPYLYHKGVETKWLSPENPKADKGVGGMKNKGAKGSAMYYIDNGEERVIAEIDGPAIIHRIWMTGGFVNSAYGRRNMLMEIYWEGDSKPAVSAPINDLFGMGLPQKTSFESELFSQPEGRSYNCFVPMPFKKSAKIVVKNYTGSKQMLFFDVDYSTVKKLPKDFMYFHAYWNRNIKTELGKDHVILPKVKGKGRFLGANIGVICDSVYKGTWFGEGEVKIYLDGDKEYPSLCGTGTEDYIGTGWGQNSFYNRTQGCPIGDADNGLYSFYRYHTIDPIFFHKDCKVTIQQLGNTTLSNIKSMLNKGIELEAVSVWSNDYLHKIYDGDCGNDVFAKDFPDGGVNFWRRDDVCSTAYFYLNSTSTELPIVDDEKLRSYQIDKFK